MAIVSASAATDAGGRRCLLASGGAAGDCVAHYASALGACRNAADAACETALRAPGGQLEVLLAATEAPVREGCTPEAADKLATAQACRKWGEDFVAVAYADNVAALAPEALACQRIVGARLARLRDDVLQAYGRRGHVAEFGGQRCHRELRDRRVVRGRALARARIAERVSAAKTCTLERLEPFPCQQDVPRRPSRADTRTRSTPVRRSARRVSVPRRAARRASRDTRSETTGGGSLGVERASSKVCGADWPGLLAAGYQRDRGRIGGGVLSSDG